jgi:mannose-1-phosphate guanylyltransferase
MAHRGGFRALTPTVMSNFYAVIMAGGRGERFWPQSRQARPKHLLPIVGDRPMVAQTVARLAGLVPPERVYILTNVDHVVAIRAACPEIPPAQIIGEPVGRDTAPAAALAALLIRRRDPQGVLALLAADSAIHDAAGFRATLAAAFATAAKEDYIFTIGIPPAYPAIAYGYLRRGEKLGECAELPWFKVAKFVEKPDRPTAERYLAEGGYWWNAGMFVTRATVLESALAKFAPSLAAGMADLDFRLNAGAGLPDALAAVYPGLTKISVDYAVMEKAPNIAVFAAAFDWDDVGEWPALMRHAAPDAAGNVTRGDITLHEAHGNLIIGEPGHLVALLGVDDLVVVHTPDATLVCPKARAQELKKLLKEVESRPGGVRWL